MDLMADLHWLAERWAREQREARGGERAWLKTLGFRTVGDSKLFERLAGGRPISVPVFETVIKHLAEPKSWPRLSIPEDACDRLALLGAPVDGVNVVIERQRVERALVVRA